MTKKPEHRKPCATRIKKAILRVQRLLRKEPDSISSGYRRGFHDALQWIIGHNRGFDRRFKTREKKK